MAAEFDQFLREACPPLGLAWRKFRRRGARRHVDARLEELGLADYGAYLARLRADPGEAAGLADRMRVTVSRFFRDHECWAALAEHVVPTLMEDVGARSTLRAWSAGCCGGEEPYSLAVLWLEWAQSRPHGAIDILATDIDDAALDRGRHATYAPASLREVPAALRTRWFTHARGRARPRDAVRRLVTFAHHNLMTDPLPTARDLVLCRYLAFTYYTGARRLDAARRLWSALGPGGALMIGAKEQLGAAELELFEPWPHAAATFRRRS